MTPEQNRDIRPEEYERLDEAIRQLKRDRGEPQEPPTEPTRDAPKVSPTKNGGTYNPDDGIVWRDKR